MNLTYRQIRRNDKFGPGAMAADLRIWSGPGMHRHLRSWRKAANLTLEEVASRLGMDTSTVSNWERGKRDLDLKDLEALATVYGVPPVVLLFAPDDRAKAERLARAHGVIAGLDETTAEQWLGMGERLSLTKVVEET